jgi:hypothetical protein
MRPAFFVVVRRGIINDEDHPMKRELESHAQKIDEQLSALTLHLAARREAILQAWRKAIDRDPELTTGASLPRT